MKKKKINFENFLKMANVRLPAHCALAKTKITTNKGHLVLEKSDRVNDSFSPFYPIDSFIPQTNGRVPSIIPTPYQKSNALTQCRWDGPRSNPILNASKVNSSAF